MPVNAQSWRANGLPILLHVHDRPALSLGLVEYLVKPSDAGGAIPPWPSPARGMLHPTGDRRAGVEMRGEPFPKITSALWSEWSCRRTCIPNTCNNCFCLGAVGGSMSSTRRRAHSSDVWRTEIRLSSYMHTIFIVCQTEQSVVSEAVMPAVQHRASSKVAPKPSTSIASSRSRLSISSTSLVLAMGGRAWSRTPISHQSFYDLVDGGTKPHNFSPYKRPNHLRQNQRYC